MTFTHGVTTTNVPVDADGLGGVFNATTLAILLNVNLTSADSASFIV